MKGYPKTCTILQYSGEVEFDANVTHLNPPLYGTHQVYLGYNFAPPRSVTIHEEYLIYWTGWMYWRNIGNVYRIFVQQHNWSTYAKNQLF